MDSKTSLLEKSTLDLPSSANPYRPPQSGILFYLPASWVPYAELIRLTRPIGIVNIHCPFLFGSLFAALVSQPTPPSSILLKVSTILFLATFFLRGSAVAFNDLADRDIDGHIARTQHRPLARKAISPFNAYVFVLAQTTIWLAILAYLSPNCLLYAVPSLGLAALYPYSKRVLDFTPLVLGLTKAWGVFIGCAAMGVDPLSLTRSKEPERTSALALICLYLFCVIWTTIYETIYAHQDIVDDEKHGVRSMAVMLRGKAKIVLSLLAALQLVLFACIVWVLAAKSWNFVASGLGIGISLAVMIWKVELKQPEQCWWWFSNGTWFVGGSVVIGFVSQISKGER